MHRDIIISAFAKAKKEEHKETGREGSTNKASERISAYISNISDIPYSSRSLRNALNDASDLSKTVEILQPKVLNTLCMYLGYENYSGYLKTNSVDNPTAQEFKAEVLNNSMPKYYKWLALLVISVILGVGVYFFSNRQRWMEWDVNHYVEVNFDSKKLQEGTLKLFKEERVENFKKVPLTCDSLFFNVDGSAKFWYGRNRKKQLEFFTDLAEHPETGKALRPLTQHMIGKYICD